MGARESEKPAPPYGVRASRLPSHGYPLAYRCLVIASGIEVEDA